MRSATAARLATTAFTLALFSLHACGDNDCARVLNPTGVIPGSEHDRATQIALVQNHLGTLQYWIDQYIEDALGRRPKRLDQLLAWRELPGKFPTDPWGNDYRIRRGLWPFSCGPDGKPQTGDDQYWRMGEELEPLVFDIDRFYFNGRPVRETLTQLRTGTTVEREDAARDMWCLHHGCPKGPGHTLWAIGGEAPKNGCVGPRARTVVSALARALEDPEPSVRRIAARSLSFIGPDAMGATAALESAARDPVKAVRITARIALEAIRGR